MNWKNISDKKSAFLTFSVMMNKMVKMPDESEKEESYSLCLEEVNKGWDRPFNWKITVSDLFGEVLAEDTFYLDVNTWSPTKAKTVSEDFFQALENPSNLEKPIQMPSWLSLQ